MQILGQKGRLSASIIIFFYEAARHPRVNHAARSLGPQSRSPTSLRIFRLQRIPALIRINRGAVAEKHHPTRNCHCSGSDIAPPGFLSYSDPAPV